MREKKSIVENGLPQEVSRGHSTESFFFREGLNNSQLPSMRRKQGNLSQNVLMRRVAAYP